MRDDAIHGEITAWRGTRLTKTQIEEFKARAKDQSQVSLMGFTSVSQDKEFAESFAFSVQDKKSETPRQMNRSKSGKTKDQANNTMPVLFQITLNSVYEHFEMNTIEYSAYCDSNDDEILLQDGSSYKVTDV